MIRHCTFLLLLSLVFLAIPTFAQDTVYVVREPVEVANPYMESLKKGKMFLGVGANLFTDNTQNQDRLTAYVLEESDRNFNIKLAYGYFIKDMKPVGIGFKYVTNELTSTYETLLLDTVNYTEINNDYIFNAYYGATTQIFGSKRFFLFSDPSIFFTGGNTKTERTTGDGNTEFSKTVRNELALGLNVGVLFFLFPNMSFGASVGPVGLGYRWENYFINDEDAGGSSFWFIRMSPDLLRVQFTMATYF